MAKVKRWRYSPAMLLAAGWALAWVVVVGVLELAGVVGDEERA